VSCFIFKLSSSIYIVSEDIFSIIIGAIGSLSLEEIKLKITTVDIKEYKNRNIIR